MKKKLEQINRINTIITMAEQAIMEETGVYLRLIVTGDIPGVDKDVHGMLRVIAATLELPEAEYLSKRRFRDGVHLRQFGCWFIREYFPELPLKKIGAMMGGQDHTTVLHSLDAVKRDLQGQDEVFMAKYNALLDAITQWMRE